MTDTLENVLQTTKAALENEVLHRSEGDLVIQRILEGYIQDLLQGFALLCFKINTRIARTKPAVKESRTKEKTQKPNISAVSPRRNIFTKRAKSGIIFRLASKPSF